MAAPKENSLFPPSPYYIPGYTGFVPQYNYRFGETFGKTTYRLLTDPGVRKSPRSLLAPLHKLKFVDDFSGMEHGVQGYLPGRPGAETDPWIPSAGDLQESPTKSQPSRAERLVPVEQPHIRPQQQPHHGYFPYENAGAATGVLEPVLRPKSPPPGLGQAEEELVMTHVDPVPQHHPGEYVPKTRVPEEYPRRISHHPAPEGQEWRLPKVTPAHGEVKTCGPHQLSGALEGSKQLVKMEGVALPEVAETAAVEQDNWLPKLDVPHVIQQKVIPGYAGFIPCFTSIGVTYTQGVKEAMDEFDRHQFLLRNPASSFGRRFPQSYWPNNRIYTSAGLMPFYTGFVPHLRHTYALTFGNSTRKAYQKEQRRRACAL